MTNDTSFYKSLTGSIVALIGLILFFIAFYLLLNRLDLFLRYKGIDECAKISSYEVTSNNTKTVYPVNDIYQACLKKKGL